MATWPPSSGSIGSMLAMPMKMLSAISTSRREPTPAWAPWTAVRTAPMIDSGRGVLFRWAWAAAVGLVTWWT